MSIRHGLLALLAEGPSYGYQLRSRLEARTGGTWPLNIGQVYTTLSRLQRDQLVEAAGDGESGGQATYRITEAGRRSVAEWFASPVERAAPARDELAIKLALAVSSPMADVRQVVQVQRVATMRAMQELTRLKARADDGADLAWLLVLDALIFQAEAEVRWLDHCESRVARAAARRPASAPAGIGAADRPTGGAGAATAGAPPPAEPDETPVGTTARRGGRR
jgi:DNA-binding PadR family transcriptional regulator